MSSGICMSFCRLICENEEVGDLCDDFIVYNGSMFVVTGLFLQPRVGIDNGWH
jgi:hypothetical protein